LPTVKYFFLEKETATSIQELICFSELRNPPYLPPIYYFLEKETATSIQELICFSELRNPPYLPPIQVFLEERKKTRTTIF